jgi:hypothetical protein
MVARVASLGRYPAYVEVRRQHLHDRFDLKHGSPQPPCLALAGEQFPGQLAVKLA